MNPFELTRNYLNRPTSSGEIGYLLLFGLVIGVVWLALLVWDSKRRSVAETPRPEVSVLGQLIESHRLSSSQIDRFHEIARELSLADPAVLFIDPRPWEILAATSTDTKLKSAAWEFGSLFFGGEFEASESSDSRRPVDAGSRLDGNRL